MSKSTQPWAKAQDPGVAAPVAEEVTADMVTVTVPKAYKLRIDHSQEFAYKAGIQKMDRVHAEHWYSKANGVAVYDTNA